MIERMGMMVISLRKWLRSGKYLILFVMLAYTLYKALGLLDDYVFREDKYRVPEGSAVKVFREGVPGSAEMETMTERLKLFFWYGE
ncbi:MAG: YqzK family protein [Paenibacillaceae bacterium]|uniref:YqzK family protein n=1 Tax=Paenibacillus mellifer TaxID=2937794 RepID=A0A9X1XVT3_9BACL|nr:DUF4227 family protein [Paenibacillus mellifer]MBW4838066.1 YqzK family protein [Paenibacillaceae bacterium]MCK8486249.1 YqzK family protein [Paenibacillus mellifer]